MSESVVSQHLQDCIAHLAIIDTDFLNLVRPALSLDLIDSQMTEFVIRICFNYFDMFGEAPKDHFSDEFAHASRKLRPTDLNRYVAYVAKLQQLAAPNVDYVVRRLNDFIKAQEFSSALVSCAELVASGKFSEAQSMMYEALRAGIERENVGLRYFTDLSLLRDRGMRMETSMRLMIPELDRLIGGFKPGMLICMLGGMKGKKSWAMHHLGKVALMQGLRVLHISHENSLEEVEERYDRILGALASGTESPAHVSVWSYDEALGHWESSVIDRPTVFDYSHVVTVRRRVQRFGGDLIIRKYPMGVCDMQEVDRFLRYLEAYERFSPDLLLNDYADVMKPLSPKKEFRHQINETYLYHKRLADERGMIVVTASQAIRSSQGKKLSIKDFAEDIRKAANVDLAIAICQTSRMEERGHAVLLVLLNRNGPQGVGCKIVMNLDLGQFCLQSFPMSFEGIRFKDSLDDNQALDKVLGGAS